jgi:DNA-binding NarL/FixJ family response regulator
MSECRQGKREDVSGVRVLVVEDEFIVSLTLKVQLEAMGCRVVGTVRDAAAAVRQAQELRPDVVLMDIGLSGGDGVEATQAIVAQIPTQVIVVTAYGDDRIAQAIQAGARLALTKPVVEEQLARAIAEVTVRRGSAEGRGNDGNGARNALSP